MEREIYNLLYYIKQNGKVPKCEEINVTQDRLKLLVKKCNSEFLFYCFHLLLRLTTGIITCIHTFSYTVTLRITLDLPVLFLGQVKMIKYE